MRKQMIEQAQCIAIFGHDSPDGDAIGSMLWLGRILENMGKSIFYFTSPLPSKIFSFLPGIEKIKNTFDYKNKYDLIIFVDFSPYIRTVFAKGQYDYFDSKPLLIVDHHLGDCPAHAIVLKDSEADSNCEWIFENTKDIRSDWYDSEVATYLYMGIVTDTNCFEHDKQWARSLRNAADLVDIGADKWTITNNIFGSLSLAQIQFTSSVMDRFIIDHGIWYVWYDTDELVHYGLEKEWSSIYITDIVRKIEWISVALIFRKDGDCFKVSLRSKTPDINVADLAGHFGGWGHFYASGMKIPIASGDDSEQKVTEVIAEVKKILSL